MCDMCHLNIKEVSLTITSGDGFVAEYCRNCSAELILQGGPIAPEGIFTSEISGAKKAVRIADDTNEYYLTPDEAFRFVNYGLLPNEFKALIKAGHSADEFDLHDDFYSDNGLAFQPLNESSYINDMKNYLTTAKLSKSEKKEIEKFLELFD